MGFSSLATDFSINAPLILTADANVKLQFAVEPNDSGKSFAFKISSYDAVRKERWICVAEGVLSAIDAAQTQSINEAVRNQNELNKVGLCEVLKSTEFYSALERIEIHYGKYFQTLDDVSFDESKAFARFRTDKPDETELRPTVFQFDGLLQTMLPLCSFSNDADSANDRLMLPISIEKMTCRFSGSKPVGTSAQITDAVSDLQENRNVKANLTMFDKNYQSIIEIENLQVASLEVPKSRQAKQTKNRELAHQVVWTKQDRRKSDETQFDRNGLWLILADKNGVGDYLKRRLEEKGNECEIIRTENCDLSSGIGKLSEFFPVENRRTLRKIKGRGAFVEFGFGRRE
ncbi:Acyl transferase domain-containing protein [Biomphalaria pfeifferi]|uniref:Acyl transferase domain-containing protein n=1 Tax=Biomphalaria pfeifferi TaxID=112525 RepID=A0AAD8AMN3_BIOPF|nr:Acyl transferase domain-containing protein [Biomphalaria pfeifferi]